MTLSFYPRGGSAQVVRYLGGALQTLGNDITVACGSLGPPGVRSNASTFFEGLDVQALDFTEAIDAGAIASEGEDGVDLIFEAEDFLGFVEVDPGGAIVEEVSGREGLRDGVIFSVEGEGIAFFEPEVPGPLFVDENMGVTHLAIQRQENRIVTRLHPGK